MEAILNHAHKNGGSLLLKQSSVAAISSFAVHFKPFTFFEDENTKQAAEVPLRIFEKEAVRGMYDLSASSVEEGPIYRQWKCLKGLKSGIPNNLIPEPAWRVLRRLGNDGFDAYLVGGSVRDLLLKRIPKDFDVVTTAELHEVKKSFLKCRIVGRRFPICHVVVHGSTVEVSSFSTRTATTENQSNRKLKGKGSKESERERDIEYIRWCDSMRRDFTINGLIYDPVNSILYDYVGGLDDLKIKVIRTVIPPTDSFREDPARIVRAIRIAGRLGFDFGKATARAMLLHSDSVFQIDKGRLAQEVHVMMAYGSAEPTMRLLRKFRLLPRIFPLQALYFSKKSDNRRLQSQSFLLLDMLQSMDSLLAPNRPCHGSLWTAVLAFHLALEMKKRTHITVAAATLAIRYQSIKEALEAIKQLKTKLKDMDYEVSEISKAHFLDSADEDENLIAKEAEDLLYDAKRSMWTMTEREILAQACPQVLTEEISPFITKDVAGKTMCLFDEAMHDIEEVDDERGEIGVQAKREMLEIGRIFAHAVLTMIYVPKNADIPAIII